MQVPCVSLQSATYWFTLLLALSDTDRDFCWTEYRSSICGVSNKPTSEAESSPVTHCVCVCNCVCGDVHVDVWCVCVPDCAYLSAYVTCFSICSCWVFFFLYFFIYYLYRSTRTHTRLYVLLLNTLTSPGDGAARLANKFFALQEPQRWAVVTGLPDGPWCWMTDAS